MFSTSLEERRSLTFWVIPVGIPPHLRNLFQISNHPDTRIIGSINKSTKAQAIILNRTTGTRRAGTHPAVRNASQVNLKDLTAGRPEMNDE